MPSSGVQTCARSEEHTSELQSHDNLVCRIISLKEHTAELQPHENLVCRLLLEKHNRSAASRVAGVCSGLTAGRRHSTESGFIFFFFFKKRAPPKFKHLTISFSLS